MESLLLQGKSKKDIEILAELARMIGLKIRHLSKEELEDIGLANAMKKGRTGEYINTQSYLKKLKGK
jgi:hypothetical protein